MATAEEIVARNAGLDNDAPEQSSSEEESDDSPVERGVQPSRVKNLPEESEASDEESDGDSSSSGFEIYNPNRNPRPIEKTGIVELSRREREELKRQSFEKQKMALMAQGKLKSAQEDLARLAEIRKRREAAMAKKLEQLSLKENGS